MREKDKELKDPMEVEPPQEAGDSMLVRNQIIEDSFTNARYRILYLPEDISVQGYWIRIDMESNIPVPFSADAVREKLAIGVMASIADVVIVPDDGALTAAGIRHRDRAWNLIRAIVTYEPDIYIKSKRAELLRTVEKASGVRSNNLYVYLGRYWRSGFQINALAANYQNCGGTRQAESLKNRVGRRKQTGENGKVLTEDDYRNFQYAIDNFRNGRSLQQTYRYMLSQLYVRERFPNDPAPVTMGEDEKPSFGQFYYWYRTKADIVKDTENTVGEHNFNLKFRAIVGRTETLLFGPGHSYQVDATIGDFYLVMKSDRGRLVGRPIIVFFKDAWSRMITGMAVTLENSSSQVWKEALLNTITNKKDFCARYGIKISDDEWPCMILPVSITTDNGEFAVKAIDEIVKELGITVENCPPYRGDLKGIIERTFKTYQLELKPFIPGYVDKDAGERGAEDYRRKARLDLEPFVAILIKVVLYYNNYHYMKDYPRTEELRRNGIPSIPRALWNYGIAHKTGALRTVEPDDYIGVLLKQGEATVTAQGIRLNHLYYTCDQARAEKWFERARISGVYTLTARYNPFSCGQIFVKGSDGRYITCELVDADQQYKGYSEADVEAAAAMDKAMKAAYTQAEDQAYSDLTHYIDDVVKRCQNEGKNGETIIGSLNRHSINENREEEKKAISGETAAREEQERLGIGAGEPDTLPGRKEGTEHADGRPRSYGSVSDDIDKVMEELGVVPAASVQES